MAQNVYHQEDHVSCPNKFQNKTPANKHLMLGWLQKIKMNYKQQ